MGLVGIVFLATWWGARKARIKPSFYLLLIGLGFLFLSMDEAAEFHEKLTRVLQHVGWLPQMKGGIWIPIYFLTALVIGFFVRSSLFSMWNNYPREVLIMAGGIALAVAGGVGLEILTHIYWRGQDPFMYQLEVIFEEFFEMAGASILLYGGLLHALRHPGLQVQQNKKAQVIAWTHKRLCGGHALHYDIKACARVHCSIKDTMWLAGEHFNRATLR